MVDGKNGKNRGSGDSADDHDRTAVFRRGSGGEPDEIERLYRPRSEGRSASGGAGSTRRMPPARDGQPPRRPSGGGRVYDGSGRDRRERNQRRERRRRIGVTFLVLLLLLFVVLPGGFYLWADSKLDRVDALEYEGRPDDHPGTTYLIVGTDGRDGLSDEEKDALGTGDAEGKRTDTIMVLYVPEGDGKPTIISIPRDSLVDVPELGENKVNSAFAEELGGGPSRLAKTVEDSIDVHLDHYVEIGMGGFVQIVDALGGVEMCPEEPIEDPKANLDVEAGCQEMDGATALGYVRTRATPNADLDRIKRQREFFSEVINKATATETLVNPFSSVPLVNDGTQAFDVNTDDHLRHLASMGLAMRESPTTTSVPVGSTPTLEGGLGSVVVWDDTRSEEMFGAMREGEEIPDSAMEENF